MAESTSDRAEILDAIQSALAGISDPVLTVVQGVPWSIQADRSCFWWYAGDGDSSLFPGRSLSERAVVEKFLINVFWLPPQAQQLQTAMVPEAWNVNRAIQQAITAHVQLGLGADGPVQGLKFEPAKAGLWQHFSGATFYALELELHLDVPSADTEAS